MSTATLQAIDGAPFLLDFQRYAPAPKPMVVWSQPSVPAAEPDELTHVLNTMREAAGIIWRGIGISLYITALRATSWCEEHILHSLTTSWAVAGTGWAAFIGISFIHVLTR